MAFNINRSKSFSMVFPAIATLLLILAGEAQAATVSRPGGGIDICGKADYPALCRSVVKGQNDPYAATWNTVKALMKETAGAKKTAVRVAAKYRQALEVCLESYDGALSDLGDSLRYLKGHDKGGLNTGLSAAMTEYNTCEDAFSEIGINSPLADINTRLIHIASNGLYLSTLWR